MKRLELANKYAYLAVSSMFVLKNVDNGINYYGMNIPAESYICENYRRVLREFGEYIKKDVRLAGGSKVKVGFVSGIYDGWAGKWGRSCL